MGYFIVDNESHMSRLTKLLLILVPTLFFFWWLTGFKLPFQKYHRTPQPVQIDMEEAVVGKVKGATLYGLAKFKIEALVLSKCDYYTENRDSISKYCPMDMALGWGPMSDLNYIKGIDIEQKNRRSTFQGEGKVTLACVATHSCNFHLIPADKKVWQGMKDVRFYQYVIMKGYLVRLSAPELSADFVSSLSRFDSGDGACEVFYVTEFKVFKPKR